MDISKALSQITGSATAQIFSKAQELQNQGKDIVHLEIGQPDYAPLDTIIEATISALKERKTAYTVSRGIEPLRKAIADLYEAERNIKLDHKKEVIVTTGAKLGIFGSVWSVTNPDDNVIILNPSWVSYGDIVESLGAEPRYLAVDMDFNFDYEQLKKLVDNKTTALILNSPSNPTGAIISEENLTKLAKFCHANDILLISDEIYDNYIYEGNHHSLLDIDNWKEIGVVISGFSKTFSMTGYRIGYVIGRPIIIDQINKVMQLTASCAVNFAQHAAVNALNHIDQMREFIKETMHKRRDLIVELLEDIGVEFKAPQGAIYAWIAIPSDNSIEWTSQLLEEKGVALTPGRAFGPDGEGFVRICFATDTDQLREGVKRIGEFLLD